MLRHSHEKTTFHALNAASHRSVSYNSDLPPPPPPPPPPFKVVPASFEHGLVLLAALTRGGRGSQAQDHRQATCTKSLYSVSSTFATGCSIDLVTVVGICLRSQFIYLS